MLEPSATRSALATRYGSTVSIKSVHRAKVDLAALEERYGADLPVAGLIKRAVCGKCGSRWPRLSITVAVENAPRVIPKREIE
jgi:hypothetical protein